jgi:hypothetical protein
MNIHLKVWAGAFNPHNRFWNGWRGVGIAIWEMLGMVFFFGFFAYIAWAIWSGA